MGLPLVTKEEYKAYRGISSTTSDAALESLIPKVSSLVKAICRRTFVDYVSNIKTEYSDGGLSTIELEETPIISIAGVDYSTDYGQTYTSLENFVNYVFSKRDSNIRPLAIRTQPMETYNSPIYGYVPYGTDTSPIFPEAINGYRVTYFAGYASIPEDLKLAILDLISFYMKNDAAVHSSKNLSPNTMQIEYVSTTNLPAHIKRVFDLYTTSYD